MKPFFNSRSKRNTACVVLWMWLFALAVGAANACLIQPEKMQDHRSQAAHSPAAEKSHAVSAAHIDEIPDYDPGLKTSKSQCLKVCDDSSQSWAKQQVGFDLTHPVLVPLIAVAVTGAQTWAATTAAQDTCHHERGRQCAPPDDGKAHGDDGSHDADDDGSTARCANQVNGPQP